jgi:glycosyltransferase involved in cell wall biosynthesis
LGIRDRLLNLDAVAACYVFSNWARDVNLRWGADPEKLSTLAPGFATPHQAAQPGLNEGFSFLFIGTDFERKGGFEVVEAFARIYGDFPGARLRLITADPWRSNPDRRIHSWVSPERRDRVLKLLLSLEALGVVTRGALVPHTELAEEIYPRADAFVMPTRAEGFGFTNVEAMSFGLPVISSNVGPIPEVVDNGNSGLLVPPGNVDALATAMARLIDDRALAGRMGSAGRARFLGRFTVERFKRGLASIYAKAVA